MRLAAPLASFVVALGLTHASVEVLRENATLHAPRAISAPLLALTGLAFLATFAITRLSAFAQVVAHGVLWLVFATTAYVTLQHGELFSRTGILAVASLVAIVLSRSVLRAALDRSAFAPIRHSRWFVVGMISAATIAVTTSLTAISATVVHRYGDAALLGGFSLMLVAGAHAVARMRAWGVIFGAPAALGIYAVAALSTHTLTPCSIHPGWEDSWMIAFALLPAFAFVMPIVLARFARVPREIFTRQR